jgi:hypothetical protein
VVLEKEGEDYFYRACAKLINMTYNQGRKDGSTSNKR